MLPLLSSSAPPVANVPQPLIWPVLLKGLLLLSNVLVAVINADHPTPRVLQAAADHKRSAERLNCAHVD
jgi:hypothetical protein